MIQLLSTFDLPDRSDLSACKQRFARFVDWLRAKDLIVTSSGVGTRVPNTPVDTALGNRRRHFTLMTFCDRPQIDAAFARISADPSDHFAIHTLIADGLFSRWELEDAS